MFTRFPPLLPHNSEVLNDYKGILGSLEGSELESVRQMWGLKMEQLKGELLELENMHADEH